MQSLIRTQNLPITLGEAWEFFSDPSNLNKMTPGDMNFRITSDLGNGRMYAGMIITYKVSPVLSIPLTWVTEITQVREPYYFVDEQLSGPYAIWHHEHHFEPFENGVMMTDKLFYKVPLGAFGNLLDRMFIRNRVEDIFEFRKKYLEATNFPDQVKP